VGVRENKDIAVCKNRRYALILPKSWILAAHSPKINELN
jgi:hypothetical protein